MAAAELTRAAYTEAEYFFGGTATAFKPTGPLGIDGGLSIRSMLNWWEFELRARVGVRLARDP